MKDRSEDNINLEGPSLFEIYNLSDDKKDIFFNKFPAVHCYYGATVIDDVNDPSDHCHNHTGDDNRKGSNKVLECGIRDGGNEQCGNISFDGVEHSLSCPHVAHRCCKNRGVEFENPDWENGSRCSFTCNDEKEEEGFRSRNYFENFHIKLHELLTAAKDDNIDSLTYFMKNVKTPRFRAPFLYENKNFCTEDFKLEANKETLEHFYLKTMPWLLMKELMEHCSIENCDADIVTVEWVQKWITSEGRLDKKMDPIKLCNWVQSHYTSCKEKNELLMITANGNDKPVMTSMGDPTTIHASHKNMWITMNCSHLQSEPINSDVIPGFKNHCETILWKTQNDGAFRTFMIAIIKYLRNIDATMSIEDVLNSEVVKNFKVEALNRYCTVYSSNMYEQLLALSDKDGNKFTPRMLTHFTDFCIAKCNHNGTINPLFDVFIGDRVAESELRVLTPSMQLFSPEQRFIDQTIHLGDWFKYSQVSNFWDRNPNLKINKIAIKMGIKINDYLTKLQKKTKIWNLMDDDLCTVDGQMIRADTKA